MVDEKRGANGCRVTVSFECNHPIRSMAGVVGFLLNAAIPPFFEWWLEAILSSRIAACLEIRPERPKGASNPPVLDWGWSDSF